MGLFSQFKISMPSKEQCVPGRSAPMHINNKHYVTGHPIKAPFPDGTETAVFGTGCFWGTEKGFWRIPGVVSTAVGYAAGYTQNPTYEEVCSGRTAHNEVVHVAFDPSVVSYADLLRNFWESHDPTQGFGQGNDRGTQYRSGIYYYNEEQKKLGEASLECYQKKLSTKITTEIIPAGPFYYAEDYHQQYLAKPGSRPYCSAQPTGNALKGTDWIPPELLDRHAPKIPEAYWQKHGPRPGCTIGFNNDQVTLSSL